MASSFLPQYAPGSKHDQSHSAGVVASCAIFIEKKGRRSELALYVLPRAIESLYETLQRRRVLPRLPYWEVALFAVCMGRLMYYRQAIVVMTLCVHIINAEICGQCS